MLGSAFLFILGLPPISQQKPPFRKPERPWGTEGFPLAEADRKGLRYGPWAWF